MNERINIGIMLCCCMFHSLQGQDTLVQMKDHFTLKGQLSAYTHLNLNNRLPWWNGGRYIPQLNYEQKMEREG